MRLNQINALKKIMKAFDETELASEQLDARHTELNDAINTNNILAAIRPALESCYVRREIINAVFDDHEFENCIIDFVCKLTEIVARWDMADHIDSATDAA
ncbi:hypothetical protein ACV6RK_002049 [Cronobacter malonaticus]